MALTPEQEALVITLISRTQKTISQLEAETALLGDKILPVENGEGTFALTVDDLKDYIEENLQLATTSLKGKSLLPSPITIAKNALDSNNDIDFTAGNFIVSDGSAQGVSSAETKRLDATWAAGNNAGGLAAGLTKAINTTYHCFKLYNPTTGATGSGFDTSFSAANLLADSAVIAAGFTKYAWRMAITTDGSGNIRAFLQDGKTIHGGILVYNSTTVPAAYTDLILSNVPVGLRVKVTLDVYISDNIANSIDFLDKVTGYAYTPNSIAANTTDRAKLSIFTDTSATVQHRGSATPATAYVITTQYWEIPDNLY